MIVGVKCLAVWESASSYLSFVVIVKGWASSTNKTNCSALRLAGLMLNKHLAAVSAHERNDMLDPDDAGGSSDPHSRGFI